jgi:hypothetical protein
MHPLCCHRSGVEWGHPTFLEESKGLQRRYLEVILCLPAEDLRLAGCLNTLCPMGRCRRALSLERSDNEFTTRRNGA